MAGLSVSGDDFALFPPKQARNRAVYGAPGPLLRLCRAVWPWRRNAASVATGGTEVVVAEAEVAIHRWRNGGGCGGGDRAGGGWWGRKGPAERHNQAPYRMPSQYPERTDSISGGAQFGSRAVGRAECPAMSGLGKTRRPSEGSAVHRFAELS